jgi:hypothetical protein
MGAARTQIIPGTAREVRLPRFAMPRESAHGGRAA